MTNKAKDLIIPKKTGVFRTVFLYVGQGDAIIHVVPDGERFKYVLVDTNNDNKNNGIEVKRLLKDLLGSNKLDVFINTHPHNDHLTGIKEIHNEVGVKEVWHSGHKPGKNHDDAYQEMMEVIKDIGKSNEYVLFGTNDQNKIRKSDKETEIIKKLGDIDFQVISPAEYVADDVQDEDQDKRYQRIHEHCAVIRFSHGTKHTKNHIMITGDSNKIAWKDHITGYHKDHLESKVLSSSHHGSRSFFKDSEDDEDVYEKHIEKIKPEYVIISSPKKSESKYGHPHEDAIDLYKKHVSKDDDVIHQGKNCECVIVDIDSVGNITFSLDKELVKEYKFKKEGEKKKEKSSNNFPELISTKNYPKIQFKNKDVRPWMGR